MCSYVYFILVPQILLHQTWNIQVKHSNKTMVTIPKIAAGCGGSTSPSLPPPALTSSAERSLLSCSQTLSQFCAETGRHTHIRTHTHTHTHTHMHMCTHAHTRTTHTHIHTHHTHMHTHTHTEVKMHSHMHR